MNYAIPNNYMPLVHVYLYSISIMMCTLHLEVYVIYSLTCKKKKKKKVLYYLYTKVKWVIFEKLLFEMLSQSICF